MIVRPFVPILFTIPPFSTISAPWCTRCSRRELNIVIFERFYWEWGIWKMIGCKWYEWLLFVSEGVVRTPRSNTTYHIHFVHHITCCTVQYHAYGNFRVFTESFCKHHRCFVLGSSLCYNHTEPCRLVGFHDKARTTLRIRDTILSSHLWWTVFPTTRSLLCYGRDLRKRITSLSSLWVLSDVILLQFFLVRTWRIYRIQPLRWYRVHTWNPNVLTHSRTMQRRIHFCHGLFLSVCK